MGKVRRLNDIANGRFLKKSPMTKTMPLSGIIRKEPLEEEFVDGRAEDIIAQLQAENIRGLVCDIARFIDGNYIDWAIKMSCQAGIRCPAARFNSLCYKHLIKSPLYKEAKRKRQFYQTRAYSS